MLIDCKFQFEAGRSLGVTIFLNICVLVAKVLFQVVFYLAGKIYLFEEFSKTFRLSGTVFLVEVFDHEFMLYVSRLKGMHA